MFELGLLLQIRKDLLLTDKTIDISNICKVQSKLMVMKCNVFFFAKHIS